MATSASRPWFAEQRGEVYAFRVNRRPLAQQGNVLAPEGTPADPFEHFVRVLQPGYEVTTGRRNQRIWRVGGIQVDEVDEVDRVLFGKLGWQPAGGADVIAEWSEEEQDWISTTAEPHGGRIMPFAFDAESRILGILNDRVTPSGTISWVFDKILNDNERELLERTTDWRVEPILDARDFVRWLRSLDSIRSVSFTARLPNPEPTDAMQDLVERMEARHASRYHETMAGEDDEGLLDVEYDRDFKQAIAMGEQGFASLRGVGYLHGQRVRYRQTEAIAREEVEYLPPDWQTVWAMLRHMVKESLRRFLQDDVA